jgi:cytochrome c oxidase subunit 1
MLGRDLRFRGLARAQPYLWIAGMTLFSTSYHIAGLRGLPRRVYSAALSGSEGEAWHTLTVVAAVGGTILFLSALAFVVVVAGTWMGRRTSDVPAFEFAQALRPATAMGIWDRFGLWTIVAVALVALAYAYPLLTLLAHPRYGSPGFKPF